MSEVTLILEAVGRGEENATDRLLVAVYEDLRRLAAGQLAKEPAGQTLQATALVHEAWLRISKGEREQLWDHRGHFFMAAAEAMRRILIDNAKRRKALKRGGDRQRVVLEEAEFVASVPSEELLDLDEALGGLAEDLPEEAKLVKLRYFGGLTVEEAAEVLGISRKVAYRYWRCARAFLSKALGGEPLK